MFRAKAAVFFMSLGALAACDEIEEKPSGFGIAHGQARPPCEEQDHSDRVPWAMPELLGQGWSEPALLPSLNTRCPEDAIEISADGATLYFYWSPRVGADSAELLTGTTGTYRAERAGSDPGVFENPTFFDLRQGVESGACDGEPSFSPGGDEVWFHSVRAENTGYHATPPVDDFLDIYVAELVDGRPGPARNAGSPPNSTSLDGEHSLNPDGSSLFLSSDRPGGLGGTDLWRADRSSATWSEPENLGDSVNTGANELQPAFAADDPDTMYFVSDRDGPAAIYRSVHDGLDWGAPELLITGYVGEPTLTADGALLYFVHVLVDDEGVYGADIWYMRSTG